MYYICIERNLIVSILNYEPNVPGHIKIYKISKEEYNDIYLQKAYFSVELKKVIYKD